MFKINILFIAFIINHAARKIFDLHDNFESLALNIFTNYDLIIV